MKTLPLFYDVPNSWDEAQNDGQRWRWALAQRAKIDPHLQKTSDLAYAEFLYNQFGVQTVMHSPYEWQENNDPRSTLSGLSDQETIARLATGVKRFELPEGHRFIELFRKHNGWDRLRYIHLNRHQRSRAADALRKIIAKETREKKRAQLQKELDQIIQPWVRFENAETHASEGGASLQITHRNTSDIQFVAQRINHRLLLANIIEELRNDPKELNHRKLQVEDLGWRMLEKDGQKYLGEQVAEWRMNVQTLADHADARHTIQTPLQEPGAYLVTATPFKGEPSLIILWVADTVLLQKRTQGGATLWCI